MKRIFLGLVIFLIALVCYFMFFKAKPQVDHGPKETPIVARKHSAPFNNYIDSLLNSYFNMKDAFVNADSTTAKAAAAKMIRLADSSRLSELKKDAAGIYESASAQLSDVKANAQSLVLQTDLTEMKQDFRMIGESIYPLLKTIHHDGQTLYWQNCPMAFGDDNGANWISNTKEIINPYLGKNHPQYKATMLHCGEIKDSIQAQ